jgi:type VI secretion system protein ImpG
MIEKYYDEELRYLYESGREFAKSHPDRARLLNIDAVGARSPQVEQLFQGFAFLTARVREKLDDAFPEFSEGLVDLLWPQLQQEIPSTAIVEFRPRPGSLQETKVLSRGAEILSQPIGPHSVLCPFTSTQDVLLNPIELAGIETSVDTKGKGALTFHFRPESAIQWQKLRLDPLRLYLHGEMPVAIALHELLTRHVTGARVFADEGRVESNITGQAAVTPGGFLPEERLLPGDAREYHGYRLLLEYFVYPEKFMFVDLHGLDALQSTDGAPERFSMTLSFDCDFPRDKPFRAENFRLFCSPVVNIFKRSIEPVPTKLTEDEYLAVADAEKLSSYSTHSLISVTGIDGASGERFVYEPQHSFRGAALRGRSYAAHYRKGYRGNRELVINVRGRPPADEGNTLAEETLALEAWCTNGTLPREELSEGGIAHPGQGFSEAITIKNITRPTLPFQPPAAEARWVFFSHLGATYTSFASADALKSFLRLYDWSGSEGRRRRIDAISDVAVRPVETLVNGYLMRGIEFAVVVEEAGFGDVNDLHLFGAALAEFFSGYVSINSYLDLVVTTKPGGKSQRWSSLKGRKWQV